MTVRRDGRRSHGAGPPIRGPFAPTQRWRTVRLTAGSPAAVPLFDGARWSHDEVVEGRWRRGEAAGIVIATCGLAAIVVLAFTNVRIESSLLSDRSSIAAAWALAVAVLVLGVVGYLLARARRSDERGQRRVQWILLTLAAVGSAAALLEAVALIFDAVSLEPFRAPIAWLLAIGAAVGVGVSVSPPEQPDLTRTLRWVLEIGALTLVAGVMWFGFAVLSGARSPTQLDSGDALALVASIGLVVASLHDPLRRGARRFVFGGPPTDVGVVQGFIDGVERATSPVEVLELLTATAVDRVRVRWARASLELPAGVGIAPVAATGIELHRADVSPAFEVTLTQGGDVLGLFECGPGRDGTLDERDRQALDALGRHAALGVVTGRQHDLLAAQLVQIQQQAEQLAASRKRLVHAQDAERRRIERDLHDGAQQQLIALIAKMRLARNQIGRDPSVAATTLEEAQEEARLALADLRRLVRGIHPPVLSDRGLVDALESLASRHLVAVEIAAPTTLRGRRFDADLEGAAYFVVSESLANSAKYAEATEVVIELVASEGRLDLTVSDDGIGFDPEAVDAGGLENLCDRLSALGGWLQVDSAEGKGTQVRASIPLQGTGRRDG